MAKFKDSMPLVDVLGPETIVPAAPATEPAPEPAEVRDRSIGDILAELRDLSAEQVEQVLEHQRAKGLRFGEAAVALGLASRDDVLYALAQQFHYPYAPEEDRKVSAELVMLREPFGPRAEAFRALRSQTMMRVWAGPPGIGERSALAVISPEAADGKSYTAANLAVALAQLGGGRTLLVDANMRHPRLHEVFALQAANGLSSVLSGRSDSRVIQQIAGVPSLFVMPVGTTPRTRWNSSSARRSTCSCASWPASSTTSSSTPRPPPTARTPASSPRAAAPPSSSRASTPAASPACTTCSVRWSAARCAWRAW